jgi:hypothetical protein
MDQWSVETYLSIRYEMFYMNLSVEPGDPPSSTLASVVFSGDGLLTTNTGNRILYKGKLGDSIVAGDA